MHEWALAEAVVVEVRRLLAPGERARRVQVGLGELQHIDPPCFQAGLEAHADQRVPATCFELTAQPVALACQVCGCTWGEGGQEPLPAAQQEAIHFLPEAATAFLRCPRCGSPDFAVLSGRGVSILAVEGA